ncbi:MAG: hypothetical protein ACRD27_11100 [Terracidiphilus sp.]
MKLAAVLFALLFGSLTLAAQTANRGFGVAGMEGLAGPNVVYQPSRVSSGCPVSMRLQQTPGGRTETVQDGKRVEQPSTRLDLTVTAHPAARVRSAAITVHGFDGRQHIVPVGAQAVKPETVWPGASKPASDDSAFTRKLDVNFRPAGGRGATAEVWVNGIGAVNWIDVDSIVYADGSTWKPAPGESCRIEPDPFELISAH